MIATCELRSDMQEQMTWTEWKAEEAGDWAGDYAEVVEEVAQEETGVELVGAGESWERVMLHCVFAAETQS